MIGHIINRSLGFLSLVGVALVCVSPAFAVPTIDTATKGNWVGVYGSSGYILPNYASKGDNTNSVPKTLANDVALLPSWVSSYTYSANTFGYTFDGVVTPADGLPYFNRTAQDPTNPSGNRTFAVAYQGGSQTFSINVALNAATEFELGVYGVDGPGGPRSTTVTIDGQPLLYSGANYTNGMWGLWDLNLPAGVLSIDVTHNGVGDNAMISAITFAQVPEPSTLALWSLLGMGSVGVVVWRQRTK